MWYFRSPQVIFGEDSLAFLESLSIKKAVIVTDKNIRKAGLVDIVKGNMPDTEILIVDDIPASDAIFIMTPFCEIFMNSFESHMGENILLQLGAMEL